MTELPSRLIHIGVDIGQRVDPTAIVVTQVLERLGRKGPSRQDRASQDRLYISTRYSGSAVVEYRTLETYYEARHIERIPLGTGYTQVAERVAQVVTSPALNGCRIVLLVDVTGVGRPVYEMIFEAVSVLAGGQGRSMPAGLRMRPITFTHGDRYDRRGNSLGKAWLVSRLQALSQTHCIKLPPSHKEAMAMMKELQDYEIHVSQEANDTYGAFKVGTHDDMVTALGLSVLDDPRDYKAGNGPRLF
jgi:hypothetical protein